MKKTWCSIVGLSMLATLAGCASEDEPEVVLSHVHLELERGNIEGPVARVDVAVTANRQEVRISFLPLPGDQDVVLPRSWDFNLGEDAARASVTATAFDAGGRELGRGRVESELFPGYSVDLVNTFGIERNQDHDRAKSDVGSKESAAWINALTVTRAGAGTGTVTGTGITCGTDCSQAFFFGTNVTLTATPGAGSVFAGWGGACTGAAPTCTVTMTAARSVTATFLPKTYILNVTRAGAGMGTVTGPVINCGASCTASYAYGTTVTLTAAPAAGSLVAGWTGCDSVSGASCTVVMTAARNVTATFQPMTYTLNVTRAGAGMGVVTGAGINCGASCSAVYNYGTVVTLVATPAAGSVFAGWSGGGCSGTGACSLTITASQSVTALFQLPGFALAVTRGGSGSGVVTSSPAGINCGASCTAVYSGGTFVTLTATAAAGSRLTDWSGCDTVSGNTCTVSMTAARNVLAFFVLDGFTLAVTKVGTGMGTIVSTPAGINCGASCAANYTAGTMVTLTAVPAAGSRITDWSGCDAITATTCTVSITSARNVLAAFTSP